MKFRYTIILISLGLLISDLIFAQRLASPRLTVTEASFSEMSASAVSWEEVEGAKTYAVTLNGKPVDVVGNALYLTGIIGKHTVTVVAKGDGVADSEISEAVINVRDYGDGSASRPYLIYDKEDWETFCLALTRNFFGNNGFSGEYVALADNIDFEGCKINPASKNYATGFQGTFDGRGRTLSNAVLEGGPIQGLFVSFRGVLKNLNVDNFTVRSRVTKASAGKSAIICAGETTGKIYNCRVTNSVVEIEGEKAGNYAAPIASVLNSPDALVYRCISINNRIKIGNSYASSMVSCVVAGVVKDCIAQNNEIYAGVRFAGGIAGLLRGPQAVIDHCVSVSNKITAGVFHAAGVVGEISSGLIVNCISDSNEISTEEGRCVGGIVGLISGDGILINSISKNCILDVRKDTRPYAGLIFSLSEKRFTGIISNCLALSGSVNVHPDAIGFIGIIGGYLAEPLRCTDCYYHKELTTRYNRIQTGRFNGFGLKSSEGSNFDCAFPVKKSDLTSSSSNSILNRLNSVRNRFTAYGALEWIIGADGFPTIK